MPLKTYWFLKRVREELRAVFSKGDMTPLAQVYQTDEWGYHFYTPVYEQWFKSLRHKPIRLLEIGVGDYAKNQMGGNSLRMSKRYFPQGHITGIDIYDKSASRKNG